MLQRLKRPSNVLVTRSSSIERNSIPYENKNQLERKRASEYSLPAPYPSGNLIINLPVATTLPVWRFTNLYIYMYIYTSVHVDNLSNL